MQNTSLGILLRGSQMIITSTDNEIDSPAQTPISQISQALRKEAYQESGILLVYLSLFILISLAAIEPLGSQKPYIAQYDS
jgi:hypothetical protein